MDDFSTEVLILGGGGAGLSAAISARASGAEVCLASKSEIGVETCTAYAYGALAGSFGQVSSGEALQRLQEKSGGLHHPDLARVLAEHGAPVVEGLAEYGVKLEITDGRAMVSARPFRAGEALTLPLTERAAKLGCRLLGPWAVADLRHEGDLSLVADLLHVQDGSTASVTCRAAVIATGGAAGIFGRSDNPGRTTADGLALALRAGAHLIDVEFVQFVSPGICEPGVPFDGCYVGPLFPAGQLLTPEGEPIERTALDARWQEVAADPARGPQRYDLLLDLTGVPPAQWQDSERLRLIRELILGDFPVTERPLRCSPLAHYTPGGIQINRRCATLAPGIFAAGEAAGGTFGAARPGGGALTDAIVFGAIAGRSAARYAASRPPVMAWAPPPRRQARGERPASAVLQEAQETLWSHAALYRTEQGLSAGLSELEELESHGLATGEGPAERLAALEARNCLLIGQALARSALIREETRGEHRRLDFPHAAEKWRSNIIVRLDQEGNLRCCTVPYPAAHNTFDPPWLR